MRLAGRPLALLTGLLAAIAVLAAGASPAAAHTGLEASDPADGATVDGPLALVVLDFTGTPTAIEDGIVAADAAGVRYVPVEVTQDDLRITARFDPPLAAGSYALAWVVRSDDTHTIDGSLAFVVNAPPATTTVAPSTTLVPTAGEQPSAADADADADADGDAAAAAPVAVEPPEPPAAPAAAAEVEDGAAVARIGRLLYIPAGVVAVGVLAFAAFAFAGRRDELDSLLRLCRWLGVGVAFGAVLEIVGLATVFDGYANLLDDAAGRAAVVRLLAGVCLVVGLGVPGGRPARPLSAAVIDDVAISDDAGTSAWRPGGRDVVGVIGAGAFAVSFAFDGHTTTEGPRAVHALASVAHVAAAAAWAGGLVAFAVVLWRRYRDGARSAAVPMVLRFSVVAMSSLAVAGAAGVLMAWFVQDDLGSYPSTEWGRLMLLKLAVVLVAAALGAYNHIVVKPALEASPDDAAVLARVRSTVTAEAVLVVVAALVTAVLVGASTI